VTKIKKVLKNVFYIYGHLLPATRTRPHEVCPNRLNAENNGGGWNVPVRTRGRRRCLHIRHWRRTTTSSTRLLLRRMSPTLQITGPPPTGPHFYRAMLCIRGTSHGPASVGLCLSVSVRLSVTSRSSTKTAKRSITQRTPHDTPGSLVFWCQRSPRNSTEVAPYEGAECRWGGSKSATFDK